MIVVTLRGEPQGKGRPRFRAAQSRAGKTFVAVYTPNATRSYENALAMAGNVAMAGKPVLEGPLDVLVLAVMGVPRSWSRKRRDAALSGVLRPTGTPDWDNLAKTLDGLNGVVWVDDKQIVRGTVDKRYGEEPMLRVEVKPVEPFAEVP